MKVLFFTYDFPYPTNSGGKVRAFNLLKHASSGVEIILFSFIRPNFDPKSLGEMKKLGIEHVELFPRRKVYSLKNVPSLLAQQSIFRSLYFDAAIERKLAAVIEKENVAVVHFESFYTAYYLSSHRPKGIVQIYGSENVEHKLYDDYVKYSVPSSLKPVFRQQSRKVTQEENRMVKSADVTLAVTETERQVFEQMGVKSSYVIENGADLSYFAFKPKKPEEKITILFIGNFSYFPNKDAVTFFYTEVFKQLPGDKLTFRIVGRGASQFASWHDKRVVLEEFLPDIREAYNTADIFVSPIKIGGGTNFKVLEAMATGVPVVAFADRVQDIGGKHERDLLAVSDPKLFGHEVSRLIDDPSLRLQLARNARTIIEKHYDWREIGKKLNKVWKDYENR